MKIPQLSKKPEIKSCHNKDWEDKKSDLNQIENMKIPIFIVGMPRSKEK